jgi:hypothetical protein
MNTPTKYGLKVGSLTSKSKGSIADFRPYIQNMDPIRQTVNAVIPLVRPLEHSWDIEGPYSRGRREYEMETPI